MYHRSIYFPLIDFLKFCLHGTSQVVLLVKNLPANAGDIRDTGSIPGLGRSPGEGHDKSLQYFCLENPMDRGAWWATVHGVTKSQTQLKQLSMQTCVSLVNLPNNPMITPSLPNLWSAYYLSLE